jgi:hypothetical protein
VTLLYCSSVDALLCYILPKVLRHLCPFHPPLINSIANDLFYQSPPASGFLIRSAVASPKRLSGSAFTPKRTLCIRGWKRVLVLGLVCLFVIWAHRREAATGLSASIPQPPCGRLAGFPLQSLARIPREIIALPLSKAGSESRWRPLARLTAACSCQTAAMFAR